MYFLICWCLKNSASLISWLYVTKTIRLTQLHCISQFKFVIISLYYNQYISKLNVITNNSEISNSNHDCGHNKYSSSTGCYFRTWNYNIYLFIYSNNKLAFSHLTLKSKTTTGIKRKTESSFTEGVFKFRRVQCNNSNL